MLNLRRVLAVVGAIFFALAALAAVPKTAVPKAMVGVYIEALTELDNDISDVTLDLRLSGKLNLSIRERDDDDDEVEHDRYHGEVKPNGKFRFVDLTDRD